MARRLEDGVGVGLVDGAHWKAPVQHLEHLVLDVGEQGHVDVEDVVQSLLELPGASAPQRVCARVVGAGLGGGQEPKEVGEGDG